MCLGRPSLSERCRQLTQVLVTRAGSSFAHTGPEGGPLWTAPIKEIHAVFNLLMADVFGYPAGGQANGWNICSMALSKQVCTLYTIFCQTFFQSCCDWYLDPRWPINFQGNNRDFYAALQFLNSGGPMLALVERLMSAGVGGSNEVIYNEFPSTQLPATTVQQPAHAVFLSPFEFYFYHFANAPVRKHQLAGGLSGSSMVTSAISGLFLCTYLL